MELGSQLGLQSRHICPTIHIRNKKPKLYSHLHFAPQRIPMGNHRMEHCQIEINTTSLRVLELVVVETRRQHVGIKVT
jgi:hypothetical protein